MEPIPQITGICGETPWASYNPGKPKADRRGEAHEVLTGSNRPRGPKRPETEPGTDRCCPVCTSPWRAIAFGHGRCTHPWHKSLR